MLDELFHYGTPRHSGRYPWGSGDNPYQHTSTFLSRYRELKSAGLTDAQIAKSMDITTTQLRAKRSIETDAELAETIAHIMTLKQKGYSNVKIGEMMGMNESSVRSYIHQAERQRYDQTKTTAEMLKRTVAEKGFIDVGVGVERYIGVSKTKLDTAVSMLEEEGYSVYNIYASQPTMKGQKTTIKVLAPPGTSWADVNFNQKDIHSIEEYSDDGGLTFWKPEYPSSVSSDRIKIRYKEEGGNDRDGTIEIRRGVQDLSLGNSSYAQVRIAVDGKYFLKGMALYSDDLPEGIDIIYNSNKALGTPKEKVFKKLEDDPSNPFKASIKANGQYHYIDENGEEKLGAINKLKEEGDWDEYSKTLSSQFLSKQSLPLINRQLDLSYAEKKQEFDEINALTNPAIKRKLLNSFADDCEASAVHLKAAALPRQSSKVILPIPSLSDKEIYAPGYRDGEKVVLIRYPHGGTFEIPELTVNNKSKAGRDILGTNPIDAVGISKAVADKLSGADFDGDSVTVIPVNDKVKVTTSPTLAALEGFDPKERYPGYEGMKKMTSRQKGIEMGSVSNLITDMTLKGATEDELARAVKHSMVVIDAEKHGLDWKTSEKENGIPALKKKYQGGERSGASTLISKASAERRIPERKPGIKITDEKTGYSKTMYVDPKTGEKLYSPTGRTYIDDKTGKEIKATESTTWMATTKDAHNLSSGTQKEEVYANYANKLKALGGMARKEALSTKDTPVSKSAKKVYANEVNSLTAKLNNALKNAPRERQAIVKANAAIRAEKEKNPDMDKDSIKKLKNRAMAAARVSVGASKKEVYVDITDKEWEAIQAGAVSSNVLSQIINNTDPDKLKKLATPHSATVISSAKVNRMIAMSNAGYSTAEIADALGVSSSTVSNHVKKGA